MGGDGGVIATQRKFVRGAKDADAVDDKINVRRNQRLRTQLCVQSQQTLREPIVSCEIGNLYSKEAILDALLNKTLNPALGHMRGLKDTKTLKFYPNPNYDESKETDGESPPKFMCPLSKLDFNGQTPFVYIWTTGFVLSRKAIREMGIEALQVEYGPFTELDIILLNPLPEELDELVSKMKLRRSRSKEERKSSKRKDPSPNPNPGDDKDKGVVVDHEDREAKKKRKEEKNTKNKVAQTDSSSSSSSSSSSFSSSSNFGTKSGSSIGMSSASLAKDATKAIQEQSAKSALYKNLFHKDKEKDVSARDLLMSVAGLRYTNGMQLG